MNKFLYLLLRRSRFLFSTLNILFKVILITFFITVCSLAFHVTASAIGMSAAINKSYIGQPLSVKIPLLNVNSPDQLIISVQSNLVNATDKPLLKAKLDRSNSQLAIHVFSEQAINEPYIELDINVNDAGTVLNKQYQILLDPVTSISETSRTPAVQPTRFTQPIKNPTVMGPYEWAEEGQVPEKFGAVLEGQSLWRVARRINKAMGVSRNQMMWALYEANQSAFATRSISSLKSGSYLTIPSYDFIVKKSDSEAKQLIEGSTNSSFVTSNNQSVSSSDVTENTSEPTTTEKTVSETEQENNNSSAFSISGDSDALTTIDEEPVFAPSQSQEIIKSLSDTVSRLTEELITKDQQIAFLKNQIETLKEIALTPVAEETQIPAEAPITIETTETNTPTFQNKQSLWPWLITAISLLLLLAMLLRNKVKKLVTDLNLFNQADKSLNFNLSGSARPKHLRKIYFKAKKRRKKKVTEKKAKTHVATHENEDDYIDFEFDNAQSIQVVDNVDFDDNFEQTLKDNDFVFAKNLIEFSRSTDLNDEQYHLAQLRLSHAQNDEDGFYKYYSSIESQIPSFSLVTRNKIDQLVVDLNEKVIEQNSISQNSA